MKLAKWAFLITLTMLALMISVPAQTLRSEKDPRNIAPTVGTGGPAGGATGLFTVYDGQTLRKGEWTLSLAYSNFDRDPGNADFAEVPVSFQIGLSDYLELFFNTELYRGVKVNNRRNLSANYLPNSQFRFGNLLQTAPAIVLAPQGTGTSQYPGFAVFRPQGNQTFTPFPYVGGNAGTFGLLPPFYSGPIFGFPTPATGNALLGPPRAGGNGADNFPGIGSVFGSILPGIVLQTANLGGVCATSTNTACVGPTVFTLAPTYLPDAPFVNRGYGETAFNQFTAGAKWRWTGPTNPIGVGIVAYYQWYSDKGNDITGFNQLQRGSSPGGNNGDIGAVFFADARVRTWMNISANVGYKYTSKVKGDFPGGSFTMLDRPDELLASVGVDFPVNKYFQPIMEFRTLQYVGGRTPNSFENSPAEGLIGARWFPYRWMSLGFAYRHHFNQQDRDSFDPDFRGNVNIVGRVPTVISTSLSGVPVGFNPSSDPHGFMFQTTFGRRNKLQGDVPRPVANVTGVTVSTRRIVIPCEPGTVPVSGSCPDGTTVSVGTTVENPGNEVLTYQQTVSAGRIVGQGANVTWDLSGVRPGTYTITSAVDNGCGFCGKTVTETVEVVKCDCKPDCACGTLSVNSGGNVQPGQELNFTANVSGGTCAEVNYRWTVSTGEIVGGQNTSAISVRANPGDNVTATVEISGSCLCASCQRTAQDTASVYQKPEAIKIDEFGKLPDDEVKARVDALYIALGNNPNAQGYIINYGTDKEITARERQIRKAIDFRKYDASRVTMVRGGPNPNGAGVWTKFWIVPPGADNPNP